GLVHDMATHRTTISFRAVAQHPATGASVYLAVMLMESGGFPTENFDRSQLDVWQEGYVAILSNHANQSMMNHNAALIIIPRFTEVAHLSTKDESLRYKGSKAHLIAVCQFLGTLDDLDLDLGTVPRRVFDDYVARHRRTGKQLTPFIRWAQTRG